MEFFGNIKNENWDPQSPYRQWDHWPPSKLTSPIKYFRKFPRRFLTSRYLLRDPSKVFTNKQLQLLYDFHENFDREHSFRPCSSSHSWLSSSRSQSFSSCSLSSDQSRKNLRTWSSWLTRKIFQKTPTNLIWHCQEKFPVSVWTWDKYWRRTITSL